MVLPGACLDAFECACKSSAMSARWAVLLLAGSLPSCAATSGREWLEAPIEPRTSFPPRAAAFAVVDETAEARPRLRHTVTLGESYVAAPQTSSPLVAGPAVQVNVTNNIPIVVNQPAGYGYGYGYGYGFAPAYTYRAGRGNAAGVAAPPVRATPGMPMKVGGDFPPPPDFGPRALK
jgi:hypothetical protein